jgi:integrase/recombinase XerD
MDRYIRAVEDFSRYFHCSPDRLGPRHIREYQAALFQKRKFSPTTVHNTWQLYAFSTLKKGAKDVALWRAKRNAVSTKLSRAGPPRDHAAEHPVSHNQRVK